MKLTKKLLPALLAGASVFAADAKTEPAYYGTNYTVPFAHAYRTLDRLGIDHHRAIDRDVYHMARLGFNGFRLHLWDVELSDANGDLLANEHLELLDYLIAQLEKRGISIVLTAQTNFGNGYPERNTDPNGAFSYDFEKCRVHDEAAAQTVQRNYLAQLAAHVNPYTGHSYAADPAIIAMEVNNEPCHSGSKEEITAYVNSMISALREAGWKKDIIYNVSHNLWRTSAFYNADIQGTTFQWYPTGLVHGRERKGNFLPVLDDYHIPFDTVPGYEKQPKYIYEYDPADVLGTYLYPAAARTFRKAGFKWITQFAYDPIDMARFNSEYQTHFLNLAYTPGKAIGMTIAAEATRRIPEGKDYGKYPVDTIFGPAREFLVSARRDLAMLNDGKLYYHTNSTDEPALDPKKLRSVAGVGSSPLVKTDGTGAYFLDKLDNSTWRLEIMPDVVLTTDPFGRPSYNRSVGEILPDDVTVTLSLPGLPADFAWQGPTTGTASNGTATLAPGTYLIGDASAFAKYKADDSFGNGNLKIGEYVMPPLSTDFAPAVVHKPATRVAPGSDIEVNATVIAPEAVDSVLIYPSTVNFWNEKNPLVKMTKTGKHQYTATVNPGNGNENHDRFAYNIVVFSGGRATTFPAKENGTPLDWDFGAGSKDGKTEYYTVELRAPEAPLVLMSAYGDPDELELSSIPEVWGPLGMRRISGAPIGENLVRLQLSKPVDDLETVSVSRYIGDIIAAYPDMAQDRTLCLSTAAAEGVDSVNIALVTRDGFTYSAKVAVSPDGIARVKTSQLSLVPTLLNPAPYPSFLERRFHPDPATAVPFKLSEAEILTLYLDNPSPFTLDLRGIWLE